MSDWTKVLITGDASGEVVGIQLAKRRRRPFSKFVRYNLMGPWSGGRVGEGGGGISHFEGTGRSSSSSGVLVLDWSHLA